MNNRQQELLTKIGNLIEEFNGKIMITPKPTQVVAGNDGLYIVRNTGNGVTVVEFWMSETDYHSLAGIISSIKS